MENRILLVVIIVTMKQELYPSWNNNNKQQQQQQQQQKTKLENLYDGICHPSRPTNQRKRKESKYLDLARELRKLWNMKVTVIATGIGALWMVPKKFGKRTERVGNWRTNRYHPIYRIVEIGQNIEKCSWDQRRLAVTQTALKNH